MAKKERIWELDAFRGLCILFMVAIHLVLDLKGFDYEGSWIFSFLRNWGGILFLLISGVCLTLGHRGYARGALVFGAGLLCSLVTWGLFRLGFSGPDIIIWFGILHCLGLCMILGQRLNRLPVWSLVLLALPLLILGYWFRTFYVAPRWLFPLGLMAEGFVSSDYFPLAPNLGWFLLGMVLGRTLYKEKRTLFPKVNAGAVPIRFLSWCGKNSLLIYLLHQPILEGLTFLLT